MAAAAFQVVNLAVTNDARTKGLRGAKRGIVLLTPGTAAATPQTRPGC